MVDSVHHLRARIWDYSRVLVAAKYLELQKKIDGLGNGILPIYEPGTVFVSLLVYSHVAYAIGYNILRVFRELLERNLATDIKKIPAAKPPSNITPLRA